MVNYKVGPYQFHKKKSWSLSFASCLNLISNLPIMSVWFLIFSVYLVCYLISTNLYSLQNASTVHFPIHLHALI